ncbi:MAG: Chromosome segregation ATPases-like protein [Candidatus Ozemobacter sibiricus]|uniref:Chromosome segregation ATPases-like protein n=1 Tax=Candidatus Ozemobacter sibiricus TaxID=2268124 RepID=A0A367ZPR8_9BACT|nr:MAG: Chromosome segregation ATPases-like protein [Candidatus Ozemobacter sibiricus]
MHPSAMLNGKQFFDTYQSAFADLPGVLVLDIGAQNVNGSLKEVCPAGFRYVGVDFVAGQGVDVVLTDPYVLPFPDASADIVVSSSCFEHSELFWVVFLEIMRVLKPRGLFYLNAPANGMIHRYPVDCWRFFPDSGLALVTWARRHGMRALLLESYISRQQPSQQIFDQWNDFVAVFLRDETCLDRFPRRILDTKTDFENGRRAGLDTILQPSALNEDQKKLALISQVVANHVRVS